MKTLILVVWALAATVAAVFVALRPVPEVGPSAPPPETRERSLRPDRSGASIEALLAMSIPKPAEPGARPEKSAEGLLAELSAFREIEYSERWNTPGFRETRRKLFGLVAWRAESHLALMKRLRASGDPEEIHELLEFLVWNPWVRSVRKGDIVQSIEKDARDMLASDPDVTRREAAAHVLFRYGRARREDFDFALARLEAEPDAEVRDALLDEVSVAGRRIGLTREEAAPFVGHLRRRFEEGEAWLAVAIADWSDDPEDFRRIREQLATETDARKRQELLNAFSGEHVLVHGRVDEARAVLIAAISDPAEDPGVRILARDFLATTFGPMDKASADAVSRYDAEQKGR